MDKDILNIHCTTVTICKNTWTGKVYKDEEEMKADVADPNTATTIDHIRQYKTVHVSPRGMNVLQKIFDGKK